MSRSTHTLNLERRNERLSSFRMVRFMYAPVRNDADRGKRMSPILSLQGRGRECDLIFPRPPLPPTLFRDRVTREPPLTRLSLPPGWRGLSPSLFLVLSLYTYTKLGSAGVPLGCDAPPMHRACTPEARGRDQEGTLRPDGRGRSARGVEKGEENGGKTST